MGQLRFWSVGLLALSALGCGVDAGETSSGGASGAGGTAGAGGTGGGGPVCPEDPATGAVEPECGIWVSTSLGDDGNDGSQSAPVATLAKAIELAEQGPGRVYACASETWTEALVVPGSVSLHGGMDCANNWVYAGGPKRAFLVPDSVIAMTWVNPGKDTYPFLTDFYVESADAVEPGGSSIAMFIPEDVGLTFTRVELVAGRGADGLNGAPGGEMPAAAGMPGSDGANACSAAVTKGGAPPQSVCDAGISKGGAGGDSGAMTAASGAPGEPGGSGGQGGLGEQAASECTDGQPGAVGTAGAPGLGGEKIQAQLSAQGFIGQNGNDGKPGSLGQGGGGGGATFGSVATCGAVDPGGAAGGSGAAGGCGGKGGKGGQAGGSSIAFATRSWLTVTRGEAIVFRTSKGGKGGNGGAPQLGGDGGVGGLGGKGAGSIQPGCDGGAGGPGGKGGWGGGGLGGFSVNVLATYNAKLFNDGPDTSYTFDDEGYPGFGDPSVLESNGEPGHGGTYFEVSP